MGKHTRPAPEHTHNWTAWIKVVKLGQQPYEMRVCTHTGCGKSERK